MAGGIKKSKTPEQLATEKLRKRTRTLISKAVSYHEDCHFHVSLLIIDEANPSRQLDFKTFKDPNYPPPNVVSLVTYDKENVTEIPATRKAC